MRPNRRFPAKAPNGKDGHPDMQGFVPLKMNILLHCHVPRQACSEEKSSSKLTVSEMKEKEQRNQLSCTAELVSLPSLTCYCPMETSRIPQKACQFNHNFPFLFVSDMNTMRINALYFTGQ